MFYVMPDVLTMKLCPDKRCPDNKECPDKKCPDNKECPDYKRLPNGT